MFRESRIRYQVNLDGRFFIHEEYETYNDLRTVNMTFDALNISNSLLHSVSNDIRTSMQPFIEKRVFNDLVKGKLENKQFWSGRDMSNFFIGIPFCDSEDFIGGISTTCTVQIEFAGKRTNIPDGKAPSNFGQPVGIFYEDALLKIRAMKPEGRPQIEITNATIEEIALGIAK